MSKGVASWMKAGIRLNSSYPFKAYLPLLSETKKIGIMTVSLSTGIKNWFMTLMMIITIIMFPISRLF